jgi:hypothetical protein
VALFNQIADTRAASGRTQSAAELEDLSLRLFDAETIKELFGR